MILWQDFYGINHPSEFKNFEEKAQLWALNSKTGPLPAIQAETFATTATTFADGKLTNQLSKWWDI